MTEYDIDVINIWTIRNIEPTSVGNIWKKGQVSFDSLDSYKIYFDAISSAITKNFIAIDDIVLKPVSGACNFLPEEAETNSRTTNFRTTVTRTTQASILEFDCDFERECSWGNLNDNSYNWTVLKASDAFSNVNAPRIDRTTLSGDGSYLTITANPTAPYALGSYSSPKLNGTKCLEFWYYMYGPEVFTK